MYDHSQLLSIAGQAELLRTTLCCSHLSWKREYFMIAVDAMDSHRLSGRDQHSLEGRVLQVRNYTVYLNVREAGFDAADRGGLLILDFEVEFLPKPS